MMKLLIIVVLLVISWYQLTKTTRAGKPRSTLTPEIMSLRP